MLGVAFIALVAIGGKLAKPGAYILFGGIVPFRIGLQAQVDAHLRVLFFAWGTLLRFARALALIRGHRLRQFCGWVQFIIERLDVGGTEEHIFPHAPVWLNAPIAHPLFQRHAVDSKHASRLTGIHEGEAPPPGLLTIVIASPLALL